MSKYLLRATMAASIVAVALALAAPVQAGEHPEKEGKPKASTYSGTIESIDEAAGTITIKKVKASRTFKLTDGCKFVTKDNKHAALSDLKVGDEVNVRFVKADDDSYHAHRVAHKGLRKGKEEGGEESE